ncbi:MAG: histidine kinase [Chitinophagaceae bacterium]|nr:histidine kinase [Chitinophagaceae bacterium]
MKRLFLPILIGTYFLTFPAGLIAQPVILDSNHVLQQPFPLYLNNAGFFMDGPGKMPPDEAAKRSFHHFSHYFSSTDKHLPPDKTWWVKVEIDNRLARDTTVIFYPGFQNFVKAYQATGGRYTLVGLCGNMLPASRLSIPHFRQALTLPVRGAAISTFYISIKNLTTYQVDPFRPYLMSRTSLSEVQEKLLDKSRVPDHIFFTGIGMFLIMMVYIVIKWLYQKDAAYLYYAITIFASIAYFLFNYFKEQNNQYWFAEYPMINHLSTDSFIFLSMFAYWRFVRKFLYVDKTKSFLGKYLKAGSNIILTTGIISLVYAWTFRDITGLIKLNSTIGVIMLIAGLYVLYAIRKVNQPLRRFIYGGLLSLVVFYSLGAAYEMVRDTPYAFLPSLGSGTPLLMIGNILEMLFFTLGLAYRNKLETQQLADITVQKAEAEMKALRAQMNPHFIFNCMHTIDAYIFKEQPEKASSFLNRFSRLIRQVLENSQYKLIGIDKELESLELYIKLEQERFDHSFNFRIDVPKELLNNHYKIPPLLLQPYAENAILHGLRHLPANHSGGELVICIADKGDTIVINITDNGIGRTAAGQINERNGKPYTSMAQQLTRQRLEMMPGNSSVTVADLTGSGSTGTIVNIQIPKIK